MKTTIISLSFILMSIFMTAQDKIYIHTATTSNISGDATYIDHPELNGNPNAPIVFCQNITPNMDLVVFNNNPTGLWYDDVDSVWAIYNENGASMPNGASFNIYIADDSEVYTHIADAANTPVSYYTELNIPGVSAASYLFYSNYYNPNGVYNEHPMGNWYTGTVRSLYAENDIHPLLGTAYKVMHAIGSSSTRFSHVSIAGDIFDDATVIDHPLLNNNPNATFLYAHYWGFGGPHTQVYLPHHTGVGYASHIGRWFVVNQDGADFPENIHLDIIVADRDPLNVQEFETINIVTHPNPVMEELHIRAPQSLESIEIYNLLGQLVFEKQLNSTSETINVSGLSKGQYIAKISIQDGTVNKKLIKK